MDRTSACALHEAMQIVDDACMLQDNSLRSPGTARCEDDVAYVVWPNVLARRHSRMLCNESPLSVHLQTAAEHEITVDVIVSMKAL